MNKLKIGDTVIATKKSVVPETWEAFKRDSGYLQVGKIKWIGKFTIFYSGEKSTPETIMVKVLNKNEYHFLRKDLIKVE